MILPLIVLHGGQSFGQFCSFVSLSACGVAPEILATSNTPLTVFPQVIEYFRVSNRMLI